MCLVSPSEKCKYVTLSYCWGNHIETPWVTTTDNLSSRQSRLGLVGLPQTLRDAITITRDLGYNYLWVDAICIVQNSLRDWEHESAMMGSVYGNSCVTIAATSSATSSDGCYNTQSIDQAQQSSSIIEIPTEVSDQRSVLYVCCWSDGQTREDQETPQQIRNGSLSKRGWALQERLFSPRTLHYSTDQLFWECRRNYVAEDGLYIQPCFTRDSPAENGDTIARELKTIIQVSPGETIFAVIWAWYDSIVTPYTRRMLTRPTDKLPAVSAIAKIVHDSTGATYHAGIWLAVIQFGLCWRIRGPEARSVEYRCPSYSWANYDGEIEWPIGIFDFAAPPPADFIVVAHSIDSESSDAFGSVTGGNLDLYGQLKPAIVSPIADDSEADRRNRNAELWEQTSDECLSMPSEIFGEILVEYDGDVTENVNVQCFLLCSTQERLPDNMTWATWMLLLQSTGYESTYRRVGIASMWGKYKGCWFDDRSRQRFRII